MGIFNKLFGNSKEPKEEIVWFEGEDPEMIKAIQEAQSKYHEIETEIINESKRLIPAMEECLIKYAVPATRKISVEHLFVSELYYNGESIKGVIASDPMYTDEVSAGMEIDIDPSRVTDWLYVINGMTNGGFTFKHMWAKFSDDEKMSYKDQPPFVWLELE